MTIGRTIRIYLDDGSISGIKHAEIVNWTGQALSAPRTLVKSLDSWEEVQKTGVYFLFGYDDDGKAAAYIGEAESVFERLQSHIANKDFWNEVVIFTSKDENLTKSHAKYLESRLVQIATSVDRYKLQNANKPQEPKLPRGDKDAMEEFISNLKVLLGVIGHKLLEPLAHIDMPAYSKTKVDSVQEEPGKELKLYFKVKSSDATSVLTSEGIVVLSGSKVSQPVADSLPSGMVKLRQKLIEQGVIVNNQFEKNYLFSSPSQAAGVICGYSINGRDCWKDSSGKSLKKIEESSS